MLRYVNRSASLGERLFAKRRIDPSTNCWLWTGALTNGYGKLGYKGKNYLVHRLSYELFVKSPTKLILHKQSCLNRQCFNPDHLYEGDDYDNMQDVRALGTHRNQNTNKIFCKYGHELDLFYKDGSRHCSECGKLRARKYRARKRELRNGT